MSKPRITVEIDEDLKNRVKSKASLIGKSMKEIIVKLLNSWVKK